MDKRIRTIISESISIKQAILADTALLNKLETITARCVETLNADGQLLFCGNGGSAADAQHLAGEFSGRFYLDRDPLPAEALHVNTSFLTAVANDYDFASAYARSVAAKGRPGDLLFAISTSGNSPNILQAAQMAKTKKMEVIGMTGASGGQLATMVDYLLNVPSTDTPRIQECHILLGHIICELVEKRIFGNQEAS